MDDALRRSTATARFNTLLLTILGVVGGILAAVGIFGVVAFFVGARTQEIGVRLALGATGGDVVRLLVWQGMRPIIVGALVGVLTSLAASRALSASLVGVSPTDPWTFTLAVAAILMLGITATVIPDRRALRVQPSSVLHGT